MTALKMEGIIVEDIIQWAGTAGIVAFYPIQNWRLIFTRNPVGLSFLAFSFITVGIAGYLALGMQLGLLGLTLGNASNLFFALLILALVWFRSSTLTINERVAGLGILLTGLIFLATLHFTASQEAIGSTVGWVGMFGVIMFYPFQNFSLFKGGDPTGLSLVAFISLACGLALYTVLGFMVSNLTLILGNGITFLGSLPIILMITFKNKQGYEPTTCQPN